MKITDQELTQRLTPLIFFSWKKFSPAKIVTAIYYDHDKIQFNIKAFQDRDHQFAE
jgi:hypothetical protein